MDMQDKHQQRRATILWRVLLLAALTFCVAASPGIPDGGGKNVGVVTQISGEVNMIRNDRYYAVSVGVNLQEKDILITGKDASLQMDMVDGTILRLGDESRVVLSDYKVDGKKKVVGALVNVLSGWLRFAVAKLQKKASYNFNTPVMMVGVRGTEGIVRAGNEDSGLFLQEGRVQVTGAHGAADKVKPQDVRGGQFINRMRGRAFRRAFRAPDKFQRRIPRSFQWRVRMARRAHLLKRRGIRPRFVRPIMQRDVDGLVKRHPHMRKRFQRRFRNFQFRRGPGAVGPRRPGMHRPGMRRPGMRKPGMHRPGMRRPGRIGPHGRRIYPGGVRKPSPFVPRSRTGYPVKRYPATRYPATRYPAKTTVKPGTTTPVLRKDAPTRTDTTKTPLPTYKPVYTSPTIKR